MGLPAATADTGVVGPVQRDLVMNARDWTPIRTAHRNELCRRRKLLLDHVSHQLPITIQSTLVLVVFVLVSQTVRPVADTLVTPTPVTEVPGTDVEGVATARKVLPLTFNPVIVTDVGVFAALGVMATRPVTMFPALSTPETLKPLEVSLAKDAAEAVGASRTYSSMDDPASDVSAP